MRIDSACFYTVASHLWQCPRSKNHGNPEQILQTPGAQTATSSQPDSVTSEFFQLSYPISSKWAIYHNPTANWRYLDYTSIVDHTPPFYSNGNNLELYTGEYGPTYGSGSNACGDLSPTYRGYCYNGHPGLDIPVATGTGVYASHAGVVIRGSEAGYDGGYGTTVLIRDETNPAFITRYSHLSQALVSFGTHVARGDQVGISGCTGSGCGGPHLHWGLYYDSTWSNNSPADQAGQVLDPYGWFSLRPNSIGAPVTDNKWAGGFSSQGSTNEPPTFSLNEGTLQGQEYINKYRAANGVHRTGFAYADSIEQWWANNYGAAGPPLGDPYYSYVYTGYCQDFEGGTYCPNGYAPYAYSDVPLNFWAHRYIEWATREGIIGGYADGTFRPSNLVTRGQLSKMIVNTFSFAINTSGGPHFCDVPTNNTFYGYIETLYNLGVISGYSGSSCGYSRAWFYPGNQVTRGEMSKFVANSAISKGWITGLDNTNIGGYPGADYWDVPSNDAFFRYVRTLADVGIVRYRRADGDPGCPYSTADCQSMGHFFNGWCATRAQVAQILHETVYALRPTNR